MRNRGAVLKKLLVVFASFALALAANLGIASAHPSRDPEPTSTPAPRVDNAATPDDEVEQEVDNDENDVDVEDVDENETEANETDEDDADDDDARTATTTTTTKTADDQRHGDNERRGRDHGGHDDREGDD
jgi:cytoskeletal protein RodZ